MRRSEDGRSWRGLHLRRRRFTGPKFAATPVRPAPTQRCQISKLYRGCGQVTCAVLPGVAPLFGTPPRYRESDNRTVLERSGDLWLSYRRSIAITKKGKKEKSRGTVDARRENAAKREENVHCDMHAYHDWWYNEVDRVTRCFLMFYIGCAGMWTTVITNKRQELRFLVPYGTLRSLEFRAKVLSINSTRLQHV